MSAEAWAVVPAVPWPPDGIGMADFRQHRQIGHGWDVQASCAGPARETQWRCSSDRYWTVRVERYHEEQQVKA